MEQATFKWLSLFGILTFALGCTGQDTDALNRQESNLQPLSILYGKYSASHRGQVPADEKAFRGFIMSLPTEDRARFKADDIDSLFISSRDNKPYHIVYAKEAGQGRSDVVAYEQEGVGGKRWVARSLGILEEVDEARFKELIP